MRVNFYSGAGSGKSTTSAWLFSELKRDGYSVELVTEYVKNWCYLNRIPQKFDQVYLFGKQLHFEDRILNSGVKNLVTDSPIHLTAIYARMYSGIEGMGELLGQIADLYEKDHPSVSIYLNRGDKVYRQEGRWGDIENAKIVDAEVLKFVQEKHKDTPETLLIADWKMKDKILEFVKNHLHH